MKGTYRCTTTGCQGTITSWSQLKCAEIWVPDLLAYHACRECSQPVRVTPNPEMPYWAKNAIVENQQIAIRILRWRKKHGKTKVKQTTLRPTNV